MNKTDLVSVVAENAGTTKAIAAKAIDATFDAITKALTEGDKVQIIGFGTFEVRERKERTGKNPRTGETIQIAAQKAPAFKAGTALKQAIN